MQSIKIQTSQNIEVEYQLAGIGDRLVAAIVDVALYIAYYTLIILLESQFHFLRHNAAVFFVFLPVSFYSLISETFFNGQTVGKRAKGIQVISLDGGQASFGQYLTRWLFALVDKWLLFGMVGIILIALSEFNQRLGDKVAGTVVVRTQQRTTLHDTIFVETAEVYQPLYPAVVQLSERDIALVREVLTRNAKLQNYELLMKTAARIKEVLAIHTAHEAQDFLYTVLKDYNHLTARM